MLLNRRMCAFGRRERSNLGSEAKLWLAADKVRNSMDAAEYKHVVLGLVLKSQGCSLN